MTTAVDFSATRREASLRAKTQGSFARHQRALKTLAGGVSSGLRRSARPYPLYYSQGSGCHLTDVDGNRYCDYTLAWGPLILGHAPAAVSEAVAIQARRGFTYGAQHDLEYQVSELLTSLIPCADRVAFANSGTEIVQVALRLARAATGRVKLLKFEGHYHGWGDDTLVSYHPSAAELAAGDGRPILCGAGQLPAENTVVAEWNDRASVERAFAANPGTISAIICEPLLANSGCIPPAAGFLEFLRETATREGALLIFDEVITGFRLHLAGAQGFYGVIPDLATYAKAAGAGAPLSVLAGKAQYMELIAEGKVVHAGTLNGNPLVLAAAKAALECLARDGGAVFADMARRGTTLRRGLERVLREAGHDAVTCGEGPVFALHFAPTAPRNYRETLASNKTLYSDFALAMLDEGVLLLPDGRWYLSAAHGDAEIAATLEAARRACA